VYDRNEKDCAADHFRATAVMTEGKTLSTLEPAAVHVRPGTVSDASAIVALIRQLAASTGEESPVTEDFVRGYCTTPGSALLVAERDGNVIGLLSWSLTLSLYHAAPCGLMEDSWSMSKRGDKASGAAL